jgi:hypothetical protein
LVVRKKPDQQRGGDNQTVAPETERQVVVFSKAPESAAGARVLIKT